MAKANEGIPPRSLIKCASISVCTNEYDDEVETTDVSVTLGLGYTKADYDLFIKMLDVEYDDGYGGQELFGTIWLKDGTWMDRGEYDGSEWWEHQTCPKIPEELEYREMI